MISNPQAMEYENKRGNPTVGHLTFLIESYKPSAWYFEVIECGRRLLLASVIGLLSRDTATAPALGVVISLLFINTFEKKIYKDDDDSYLGITCSYSLTLIFLSALLIKVNITKDKGQEQDAFGILLILILFAGPGLIIAQVMRSIRMNSKMTNKVPGEKLKIAEVDSEMKDASDVDNLPPLRELKSKKSVTLRGEPVNETVNDVDNILRKAKLAVRLSKIAAVAIPKAVRSKKSEVEHHPEKRAGHISKVPAVAIKKAHEVHKVFAFGRAVNANEAEAAKASILAVKRHELLMHKTDLKEGKVKQSKASRLSEEDEKWGGEGDMGFASVPLREASRARYTEADLVGSSI
jgi:hypothetical protein